MGYCPSYGSLSMMHKWCNSIFNYRPLERNENILRDLYLDEEWRDTMRLRMELLYAIVMEEIVTDVAFKSDFGVLIYIIMLLMKIPNSFISHEEILGMIDYSKNHTLKMGTDIKKAVEDIKDDIIKNVMKRVDDIPRFHFDPNKKELPIGMIGIDLILQRVPRPDVIIEAAHTDELSAALTMFLQYAVSMRTFPNGSSERQTLDIWSHMIKKLSWIFHIPFVGNSGQALRYLYNPYKNLLIDIYQIVQNNHDLRLITHPEKQWVPDDGTTEQILSGEFFHSRINSQMCSIQSNMTSHNMSTQSKMSQLFSEVATLKLKIKELEVEIEEKNNIIHTYDPFIT